MTEIDPQTRGAATPASHNSAVDLLARTLYGEARGEGVRGMEAVAAVVMNRVRRSQRRGWYWWGNTVEEVCLQPSQFSCWNANDPNRVAILSVDPQDPLFRVCVRIARRAVAGVLKDPTGGATHYHAAGLEPVWAVGREPSAIIGHHQFYNDVE